jgi:NAD(P)-dependent dehydrogenase (short-subunit alcohol dehydrogenase family)
MAEECEQSVESVDILFNNAGRNIAQTFEYTTEETWEKMLGTNLTSVFLCSKYLLPLLKKSPAGSIINHASVDAILGNPRFAAYTAAKGGVVPLTHIMAHNLAKYGIRVNCICTGGIRTGMTGAIQSIYHTRISVTPLQRMGEPEEVARAALFLASDESSYVNAANLVIDGGRTSITQGCFQTGLPE